MRRTTSLLALTLILSSAMAGPALAQSPDDRGVNADVHPRRVMKPAKHDKKKHSKELIQIKLVEGSPERVEGDLPVKDDSIVGRLKKSGALKNVKPMVPGSRSELRELKKRGEKRTGKQQADMSLWLVARLGKQPMDKVLAELNADPGVEQAMAMPLPADLPSESMPARTLPRDVVTPDDGSPQTTPDFTSRQGYAGPAAGYGTDVRAAASQPGGQGENVSVADAEYEWDTLHEDLPSLNRSDAFIGSLRLWDPTKSDTSHGTAVMGVLVGAENGSGVTGLVPRATPYLVPTVSQENGYSVAAALTLATKKLVPGDVILVEQQTGGCGEGDRDFVAAEWDPAVHDSVAVAVAKGIHVVEAAGNGAQDLDDECYGGMNFPAGLGDSGAIIVGAAVSPLSGGVPGTRRPSSSHGARVNLNGWGELVTTTGGNSDLFHDGSHRNYTSSFNGTSSASPIVAGAVAQISSIAEAKGRTLTPEEMRAALVATGTRGPADQEIGVLPNVPKALAALGLVAGDQQAPALVNGDFELGDEGWSGDVGAIYEWGTPAASSGLQMAYLGGYGYTRTETITTKVKIPQGRSSLLYDLRVMTKETSRYTAYDKLSLRLVNARGDVVALLGSHSNVDASYTYATKKADLSPWAGQELTLRVQMNEDSGAATDFLVDNFRVTP